ncbi:MAG: CinA family nicotinamide mononucleotide deamidase-related protein [Nitriliruptoraceae bacterium]
MSGPRTPLRAAVLSVGSELLLGDLTDTNATWISRRLTEHGVEVVHHLAVGDDVDRLVASVRWLAAEVDLLIVGGGLGPTSDDLTREALAAAAGRDLVHHPELEEDLVARFAAMGRRMAPQNVRQTYLPEGAHPIPAVGTAPGFRLELGDGRGTHVVAMPGVPWELHAQFADAVLPLLAELTGGGVTVTRVLHVAGRGESDVAEIVEPLVDQSEGTVLSFLARSSEIQVRLTVWAPDREAALARSEPLVQRLTSALGGAVVGVDDEDLETVVLRLLRARGRTLATAESATAGDIAARLARVPGASDALVGGVVVYTAGAKRDVLGLPASLLQTHGTVSEETTRALAAAAQQRFHSDHALAVTGVAGPSGVEGLPVGTAYWALAHPDGEVEVHGRRIPGDRQQVIARLGSAALDLLRLRLADA